MKKISLILLSALSINTFAGEYIAKFPIEGNVYKAPQQEVPEDNWIPTDNLYLTDWQNTLSDCKWSNSSYLVGELNQQTRTCENFESRSYQAREINTVNNKFRNVGPIMDENRNSTEVIGDRNLSCYYEKEGNKNYFITIDDSNTIEAIARDVFFNNQKIELSTFMGNHENDFQMEAEINGNTLIISPNVISDSVQAGHITRYYPICRVN